MNLRFQSEFALAVECCAPDAPGRAAKAAQLADAVDWARFLAICRRHRIQGLAWRAIGRLALSPPADIARQLESDAVRIATDGLRAAGVCANLLGACERAGIAILFVKGLTLSRLAYGDGFVKMSHDIDILVRQSDVDRSGATLLGMGYVQAVPRHRQLAAWHKVHKESVWTRHGAPTIELHSRLADNPRLIPGIGTDSPTQLVEVAPGISLPTLAENELIAYLAVHGASSAWFRLKWIADFAALLVGRQPDDIARLVTRASRFGAGRAVTAAVILSNRLFGTMPYPASTSESGGLASRLLAEIAMRELSDQTEPTLQPLGTLGIHISQILVLPEVSSQASELARQLRAALWRG